MPDEIERIAAPAVPTPAGHYSHATGWRDLIFVSGQLGARADGSHTADLPFDEQVRQSIANLQAILAEARCGLGDVLKVTAYVVGVDNWPVFNRIYGDLFGASRPARTVVPVPALHHGYLIEIDAIARRPS